MVPRLIIALAAAVLLAAGSPAEPENLGLLKARVLAYLESDEYFDEIEPVARRAIDYIAERAARRAPGERLAIVLDIDETALSNLPHLKATDFGYSERAWDAWLDEARGPAILPVLGVYRAARANEVAVFFISGRRERTRAGTVRNLVGQGYSQFEALLLKDDYSKEPTVAFKTRERGRITAEGWTIIVNMGDQESDLAGGFSERAYKVPNPAYHIK